MLAVARQRFREELDYMLEAERTSIFAELHAGDPFIVVPARARQPHHEARPHDLLR